MFQIKNKKTKKIGLSAIGILFAAVLLYYWLVPKPIPVQTAVVSRGIFHETIRADAVLRARDRWLLTTFADGDIKQINLRVGDPVQKGQVITTLLWNEKYDPIRSPATGVISKIFRDSPGPVRRGEPLLEIVDPDKPEIIAELLTTDAVRVHIGDSVLVTGWGGSAPLHAHVIRVSRAGFVKPSALGVEEERTEVVSSFDQIPSEVKSRIGSNYHVEVQIQVAEHPQALLIPTGALFRDQDHWAVFKYLNSRAQIAPVEISVRGNEDAVVVQGLKEGDLVIVYPGDLVRSGTKVQSH